MCILSLARLAEKGPPNRPSLPHSISIPLPLLLFFRPLLHTQKSTFCSVFSNLTVNHVDIHVEHPILRLPDTITAPSPSSGNEFRCHIPAELCEHRSPHKTAPTQDEYRSQTSGSSSHASSSMDEHEGAIKKGWTVNKKRRVVSLC